MERVMHPSATRIAFAATLLTCAALVVAPWRGHVDDTDAQLYLVIERTMARAHEWFDLRCLPAFYPSFREHLPFAFWPGIAAIRLFGEWAVNPLSALFTLSAIYLAGRIAARIGGTWAGVAAMLLLGTCEVIWQYGGRPLIEPALYLFATAAAAAALEDRWILAAILGAVATLIKGPFGLLPLGCVAVTRLPDKRAPIAVVSAVLPFALFIWLDPGGGWRTQYLHDRLLGLAGGSINNGIVMWWFPFSVVARRFWPGFPFLILGLAQAVRNPRLRPLAGACVLMVALLCIPERKWGNHAYVAFPLLGALAGVAAGSLLERVKPQAMAVTLAMASVVPWAGSISGIWARVLKPPCVFSTTLAPALDGLKPDDPILVVSPEVETLAIVELAAERKLSPWPAQALPADGTIHSAVIRDGIAVPQSWMTIAKSGGWSFASDRH